VRRRGKFITLEGGEGSGKSTQAALLAAWLRSLGIVVCLTREPGGSPRAEVLRELLLGGRVAPFGAKAEALFFAVARADHMAETIRPALAEGEWVVSDRFMDSTRAYQGTAGVSAEALDRLERIAVGDDRPDLTLILDLPANVGLQRAQGRGIAADRFETDALAMHEARRNAFLDIAASHPERCVVINAGLAEDAVAKAVKAAVGARLNPPSWNT
jgi:dTMP kinase